MDARWAAWAALVLASTGCVGTAGGSTTHAKPHHPSAPLAPAERSDLAAAAPEPAKLRIPPRPRTRAAYLVAQIRRPLRTPFGTVRPRTIYGQPVWAPVVRRRGVHGRLLVPLGPRGRVVHADLRRFPLEWRRARVMVDLGRARLTVRSGVRRVATFPIGQGAPGMRTPVGRFVVTDRLTFPTGSPYAPIAFGLSAHASRLPSSWMGGDQIAIHYGLMGAVSHGCIHVGFGAIRLLRKTAPLGTLVVVRR